MQAFSNNAEKEPTFVPEKRFWAFPLTWIGGFLTGMLVAVLFLYGIIFGVTLTCG
jgi:hypothetical protein